jgi:hypothetical protein
MYGSAVSAPGGSTTEMILTCVSAGHGLRATSLTAVSLHGEPSVASNIFIVPAVLPEEI